MVDHRKYPSYASVLENLKRLFGETTHPDKRAIQDIYSLAGRSHYSDEQNRTWLRNKLTDIKHYGLAQPVRSPIDNKTVEYVQLTPKGKRALSETSLQVSVQAIPSAPVVLTEPRRLEPTLDAVAEEIRRLRVLNPNLHIELSVTVREEAAFATR